MLLTNEARIESNQLSANKEAKLNYAANIAQAGPNNKKPSGQANRYQGNWNKNANYLGNNGGKGGYGRGFSGQGRDNRNNGRCWNNRMTWNGGMLGPFRGRGGFNSSSNNNSGFGKHVFNNKKGVLNSSISAVIYQICFKPKYITAECRNNYNKEFVPSYPPPSYNLYQTSTLRAT